MEIFKILIPIFMTMLVAMPIAVGIYLKIKNKLDEKNLCYLILLCGVLIRLAYISYTDSHVRQHDLGSLYTINDDHLGYMVYILEHRFWPMCDPRDNYQYYHPPFYYILCSAVLRVLDALGVDYRIVAPGFFQIFSVAYSEIFCVLAYMTMKELGFKGKVLALTTAVVTFHPTLIILSGSINNDMLSSLLGMSAIYFTVRWAKERRMRDIIFTALSVGFGMLTKLTVGLISPAIAAVFLTVLIKQRKEWKRLVPQFAVFAVICLPLGLFWSVRNYVRFGMPPNYVVRIAETAEQYISVPPLQRLFDYSLYQFSSPFMQWTTIEGMTYNEFNPVIALLKSAMFDEEPLFAPHTVMEGVCMALFISGAVTAVLSAAAVIIMLTKKEKLPLEFKLLILIIFGVIFGNYIIFCLNYPFVCTENMRYCVPLIFAGSAALGLLIRRSEESGNAVMRFTGKAACVSMTAMCTFSIIVYTAMLYYGVILIG